MKLLEKNKFIDDIELHRDSKKKEFLVNFCPIGQFFEWAGGNEEYIDSFYINVDDLNCLSHIQRSAVFKALKKAAKLYGLKLEYDDGMLDIVEDEDSDLIELSIQYTGTFPSLLDRIVKAYFECIYILIKEQYMESIDLFGAYYTQIGDVGAINDLYIDLTPALCLFLGIGNNTDFGRELYLETYFRAYFAQYVGTENVYLNVENNGIFLEISFKYGISSIFTQEFYSEVRKRVENYVDKHWDSEDDSDFDYFQCVQELCEGTEVFNEFAYQVIKEWLTKDIGEILYNAIRDYEEEYNIFLPKHYERQSRLGGILDG